MLARRSVSSQVVEPRWQHARQAVGAQAPIAGRRWHRSAARQGPLSQWRVGWDLGRTCSTIFSVTLMGLAAIAHDAFAASTCPHNQNCPYERRQPGRTSKEPREWRSVRMGRGLLGVRTLSMQLIDSLPSTAGHEKNSSSYKQMRVPATDSSPFAHL